MPGLLFDIQNYALYDGPGIRTLVFLKGCPLNCYWCHNPEGQSIDIEIAYFRERCAGIKCGRCARVCPREAVQAGKKSIRRNRALCTACGACETACPHGAIERIGYRADVNAVVETVMRDRAFFESSGGGVTLTGGEPTCQADFLLELLNAFKKNGVHTTLETCGFFPEDLTGRLVEKVDLFLFDLKHMDSERHREAAGVGNEIILENFAYILKMAGAVRVIPRIPLIPGFNTDPLSLDRLIAFLQCLHYRGPVHLLPGHFWAVEKYRCIGREGDFVNPGTHNKEQLEQITLRFSRSGLEPHLQT